MEQNQEVNTQESAEEAVADFLFGKEEPAPEEQDDYEPQQNAQVEGDEAEEDPEEAEASAEEDSEETGEVEFVEVEYDGRLYEVPTELKDALLRNSDYTQKTQEVSAQRKEIEVRLAEVEDRAKQFEFAESIREDIIKAEQLGQTAEQYHQYLRDNIDTLSPTEIEKLRMAIEDARSERDQIATSLQGKQQEFQQAREQSLQELLNKGTEVLRSKIPDWGESHQKQVRDYATNLGFTEAELNSVVDPRHVEVLWKASQYDSLQSGKAAAVKKVKEAPAIKPRARDPKTGQFQKEKALKKALKSNIPASAKADIIGDDIAGRFFS